MHYKHQIICTNYERMALITKYTYIEVFTGVF